MADYVSLRSNLVSLFACDDASSPLVDQIGSNDAAETGSPTFAYNQASIIPTVSGGCVRKNATNGGWLDTDASGVNADTIKSIEAWIKPENQFTSTDSILTFNQDANNGYMLNVGLNGNSQSGKIQGSWKIGGTAVSATTNTTVLTADGTNTYHIVATFNGSAVAIYLNGSAVASTAGTTGIPLTGTTDLCIGHVGQDLWALDGYMQMVALYNVVLDSDTVAAYYGYGLALPGGGMRNRIARGNVNHRCLVRF